MQTTTERDWGLVLGGIALAIAGLVLMFWPGLTMVTLATVAGIMFIAAGVVDAINMFRFRHVRGISVWAVINALCNLILGVLFLIHPITGAVVLAWFVGAFVIAYGVFAITAAIGLRKSGVSWDWMLCNGIVSVICGAGFFFLPEMIVYFVSFFLIIRGVTMAVYGATAPQALTGGLFGMRP